MQIYQVWKLQHERGVTFLDHPVRLYLIFQHYSIISFFFCQVQSVLDLFCTSDLSCNCIVLFQPLIIAF